jgi:transposase InsO family protein
MEVHPVGLPPEGHDAREVDRRWRLDGEGRSGEEQQPLGREIDGPKQPPGERQLFYRGDGRERDGHRLQESPRGHGEGEARAIAPGGDDRTPGLADLGARRRGRIERRNDRALESSGREGPFRTLNVLDEANREALAIEIGVSIPATRVIRVLDQLLVLHGKPHALRLDNGPEFTAQVFTEWCGAQGIALRYIQPGKPDQNAFIERFNRTYRHEPGRSPIMRGLLDGEAYGYPPRGEDQNERLPQQTPATAVESA